MNKPSSNRTLSRGALVDLPRLLMRSSGVSVTTAKSLSSSSLSSISIVAMLGIEVSVHTLGSNRASDSSV